MMKSTYQFYADKRLSSILFGGMQTLIDSLYEELEELENVKVIFGSNFEDATEASKKLGLEKHSIIWAAPPKVEK